jgi:hypothetical protein
LIQGAGREVMGSAEIAERGLGTAGLVKPACCLLSKTKYRKAAVSACDFAPLTTVLAYRKKKT